MFAIVAVVVGVARGCSIQIDVGHTWNLMRLRRAYDCLAAASLLILFAVIEIAFAAVGPADQSTMELGMSMAASFLAGQAGAMVV
jgi:hypothetical protein